ncbi:carbon-nitrogen hydrolase family protein [Methylobacterium organophilum]|uniref:carbon-nitrogen hydrolase family protein n=1 Tax=Methylobacterium organophilum TaxID=410 RepID=UPI001F134DEE|nr:carbon-nitrogen hydrolase family protein [Methylobacterium organophilum]UMY16745.1 carbon-nitrogen hydrolase family protein [Methylobacterium organophilum]
MSVPYPQFKAAACHVAPVFLDSAATAEKAVALIGEAARAGAGLVVFPEGYMPGFPLWVALRAPIHNHDLFKRLAAQSVRLDGPEIGAVRAAARRHGVLVSLGFSESTEASVGCLWNANVLIGRNGAILNHHRKLVPTFYEKLVWANGDARGLRVTPTEIGRIGMLICGENTNPLARYALMAQGEQVHISTYPPAWPTRPPGESAAYDLKRAIEIRAGAHAFEAKVFNIVCSAVLDAAAKEAVCGGDTSLADIVERTPAGVSMVLDPTGSHVVEPHQGDEAIVYADIDVSACVEPKQFHDVVGYYNRFDIFQLNVDRTPREPVSFDAAVQTLGYGADSGDGPDAFGPGAGAAQPGLGERAAEPHRRGGH